MSSPETSTPGPAALLAGRVRRPFLAGMLAILVAAIWVAHAAKTASGGPFATLSAQPYAGTGNARQVLDLHYAPQGAPRPVILYIHGGAWNSGSRHEGDPLVDSLLRDGFAVALIEYRLTDEAHYPAQLEDCQAAMRWLRDHAAAYRLDAAKVGVWGYSAGAQLAAILALVGDASPAGNSAPQAAALWAAPTDLSLYLEHPVLPALLGGTPTREKALAASPIHFVHAGAPPFFLAHGDRDNVVSPTQSVLLRDALAKAGVPATLVALKGQDHLLMTRPANFPDTVAFFHRVLLSQRSGEIPASPPPAVTPPDAR